MSRTENDKSPVDLSDITIYQNQYNLHFRSLKYFGLRYIADEDIVCDLIQDLWLKLWEKKETFANEIAFKSYIFRVLYNSILNYKKHEVVHNDYMSRMDLDEAVEKNIFDKIVEAEVYAAINMVFEELHESCRRVYAESLNGKSQKEISEEFNISINTVKKHINNANHFLKKRLKHKLTYIINIIRIFN